MSRHIQTSDPEKRQLHNQTLKGKLILTALTGRTAAFLLQNDRLIWTQFFDLINTDRIGQIYIGKVKNVVPNMNACFVEIANGEICYLSMKDISFNLVQGDELPVQIIREAIKTKPAAVTNAIELQSDYFVIKSDKPGIGISNKLDKANNLRIRRLLETIIEETPEVNCCVIARTMCGELNDDQLAEEYKKLYAAYRQVHEKAKFRTCFSCIYADNSPVKNLLKQVPAYEYDEIITDIPEIYNELDQNNFAQRPYRFYNDENFSLTNLYGLNSKFEEACAKKVWMRSGANLVIEQTECLTAIDVNSGKNTKGKISDDAIHQINIEAAKEAAIQIRLRNLSGIIIIDFINMKSKEREQELLRLLSELTSKDPISTHVVDMTPLGLVEITRKKVYKSLKEQLSE